MYKLLGLLKQFISMLVVLAQLSKICCPTAKSTHLI